ncbi:tyrosine-protein phosphatase 10D isoform X2 [Schistocerca nitens]|uniref:tyrosine-protein phosphatase 10D isoform X2 n=1 Tax=Schistocerca nitens TaxID=7011 RepID=UPI0021187A33|nr:tyrosine-protein phosphatase 10D isoform X2 [Schistocerca nitens]
MRIFQEVSIRWRCNFLSLLFLLSCSIKFASCADLAIQIPGNLSQDGLYRLDYSPPHGKPAPNTTIASKDIGDVIEFSQGLPGTKYNFWLYYSNSSFQDLLTWTASITTAPDAPTNLSVTVHSGKVTDVSWSPPLVGHASGYKIKVLTIGDSREPFRVVLQEEETGLHYRLQNLTPGGSYQVQLLTVYEGKESLVYISRNFTTKPNTPGKFIVWFRNETTLLVLWQPPYPPGIFTHYKVSIDPDDAVQSVLYVEKEGDPPGPAQAAFQGLVPGRAYNISVQTVSEDEISTPTTAQYRTVPLRPLNLTFDRSSITETSFRVEWQPPKGKSEFDKYQVLIAAGLRRPTPVSVNRGEPTVWEFKENLEPGHTYQVVIKTVSGKVTSWPVTGNVTLKPLPVLDVQAVTDESTGLVSITWTPDNSSFQDNYKISYHEVETVQGDTNWLYVDKPHVVVESLLPGRNYSITVQAVSNQLESNGTSIYAATRPSAPIIKDLLPMEKGLNITWKCDVQTRQDKFEVIYKRNDTGQSVTKVTTLSYVLLEDLYPGAGYEVKVFAISHGLRSEPHEYFQAVYPYPPQNLTIERTTSNSILVRWDAPKNTLFSDFLIKYRTEDETSWVKLPLLQVPEAEIADMTPGEKYIIQVTTVSYGVESNKPQEVNNTVRPNPVTAIAVLVDSSNVTLEWPRPEGRIEYYVIKWRAEDDPDTAEQTRNLTEQNVHGVSLGSNPPLVRMLIGDLMPGLKYFFQIHTVSHGMKSDNTTLSKRTMPLIQSEVVPVLEATATDSMTLRYTPTPQSVSHFDHYRFELSDPSIPPIEKAANDTETKVTFTGLVPGKLYNITVWTVSDGIFSQPQLRQDRLYPEPVSSINATKITDTQITLTWIPPRGELSDFEVTYQNADGLLIHNLTKLNSITISNLKPHWNYTFTVVVRSGTESSFLKPSVPASGIFTTEESVPGMVENFHPTEVQPSYITFTWMLPGDAQNGVIKKFTITYGLELSTHTQSRDFLPTEFSGTIRTLIPGKTYIFKIQAETKVGYGPEAKWKAKMPIFAPPKPNTQVFPTEVSRSSTTIKIRFRKNYFSEQNGAITSYTIIVAEDDSKNASGLEMPSWRDVQAYSVWPPYQVLDPYNPFKNSTVEDFTIGTESCDMRKLGYCNGALKSGSTYKVKIRAFTDVDKFTDTYYSFPIQTDQDNTPVVVGTVVPLILLLLLAITVWTLRRQKRSKRKTAESRGNDNLSIPDSIIETSRPIRLENFAEHYRIMSADSDFRFSEEFEELKHIGRDQPCSAADLPCNRPKNRFTNILPYDHSRFKLQPVDDEEGSDYINANYVPGHNSPREFLVTQGPLHSTRDDFWRMCWESNSRAIVMLTRCIEKGREKCDHYWPYDTMPVYYGDISVQILNDSHYPDWSVTEFMMCRGDVSRVIRHFHFTTWPDFGVPSPPQTLVRFVRAFRERVGPDQRPIVVHCSAGVGRSGTFIALDRLLQQINVSDHVDIFGIVWQMRKERVWMVQTEQQYICIHQCVLAVLEGKENQGPLREIHDNQGFEARCSHLPSTVLRESTSPAC